MFGPKYWYNFRKKVIIIFSSFNTRHTDFVKDFATFSHLDKVSYLGKCTMALARGDLMLPLAYVMGGAQNV